MTDHAIRDFILHITFWIQPHFHSLSLSIPHCILVPVHSHSGNERLEIHFKSGLGTKLWDKTFQLVQTETEERTTEFQVSPRICLGDRRMERNSRLKGLLICHSRRVYIIVEEFSILFLSDLSTTFQTALLPSHHSLSFGWNLIFLFLSSFHLLRSEGGKNQKRKWTKRKKFPIFGIHFSIIFMACFLSSLPQWGEAEESRRREKGFKEQKHSPRDENVSSSLSLFLILLRIVFVSFPFLSVIDLCSSWVRIKVTKCP